MLRRPLLCSTDVATNRTTKGDTVAQDRRMQLKAAVDSAEANGWTYIGNNTVRRMTTHVTPGYAIAAGWWTSAEYSTCEFLSFVVPAGGRVPKVVYGTTPCPWVRLAESSISFKKALDLLAQPLDQSDIHDRD